jgi:reactive intermediate/imine deaminase
MSKSAIFTTQAPQPIGTYSQAVKSGEMVFLSAQAPLVPATTEVVEGGIEAQIRQSFANLAAVAQAAGGSTDHIVKVTVYLTDLANFPTVNLVMEELFRAPFPARAAIGVASLPRATAVAVEAIMHIPG